MTPPRRGACRRSPASSSAPTTSWCARSRPRSPGSAGCSAWPSCRPTPPLRVRCRSPRRVAFLPSNFRGHPPGQREPPPNRRGPGAVFLCLKSAADADHVALGRGEGDRAATAGPGLDGEHDARRDAATGEHERLADTVAQQDIDVGVAGLGEDLFYRHRSRHALTVLPVGARRKDLESMEPGLRAAAVVVPRFAAWVEGPY